jgi:hypothetical protein
LADFGVKQFGKLPRITPGELRLKPSAKYKLTQVDAASAITKLGKIMPSTQVPIKTFGPDQGESHYNDGSGSIGKPNDIVVTLMRLTNPNSGAVSPQMSLEYRNELTADIPMSLMRSHVAFHR